MYFENHWSRFFTKRRYLFKTFKNECYAVIKVLNINKLLDIYR